jgi:hypothetical protein
VEKGILTKEEFLEMVKVGGNNYAKQSFREGRLKGFRKSG